MASRLADVKAIFDYYNVPYDLHVDGTRDPDGATGRLARLASDPRPLSEIEYYIRKTAEAPYNRTAIRQRKTQLDAMRQHGGFSGGIGEEITSPTGQPEFDDDAYEFLRRQFANWGISGLDNAIRNYLEEGYDSNTIALLLQDTPQYKQRFAANEKRRAQSLPVLSPAEYLATERAYREILSAAGLPAGFYDTPQDFQKWIEGDVAPTEIKERVDAAVALVNNVDPDIRRYFEQHYSTGDMIAYALDRKRATAVLNRQVAAAGIGGAAASQGVGIGTGLAERLAQTGLDSEQARAGFGVVAGERELAEKIGSLYGESYGEEDLIDEVFFSDADAQRKRQRLASRERATFSGRSAIGQGSLSRDTTGRF